MRKIIFVIIILYVFIFSGNLIFAQVEEVSDYEDFIWDPIPPQALNLDRIKAKIGYPEVALDAGIEGIVIVKMLVDEEGNCAKYQVIKKAHPILQEAVEKYVSEIKWKPVMQNGKKVKFWVNIPFRFRLPYEKGKVLNLNKVMREIGYPPADFSGCGGCIEGSVVARILVDREGRYVKHEIIKEAHPILQEAVEKHLKELRFKPATEDERPVSSWINVPFQLRFD